LKKQYQIEKQRAVQQFRRIADEQNPNIQMILPLADIVGLLQEGVGNLVRETGLALMQTVMEAEVRHLAGERHPQHEGRRAHRWGKEDGYCVVDGQKVPIRKTRLRRLSHAEFLREIDRCTNGRTNRRLAPRTRNLAHRIFEPEVLAVARRKTSAHDK
jgi:hypothetical protein